MTLVKEIASGPGKTATGEETRMNPENSTVQEILEEYDKAVQLLHRCNEYLLRANPAGNLPESVASYLARIDWDYKPSADVDRDPGDENQTPRPLPYWDQSDGVPLDEEDNE
jgi:hypothetical protein